ncbi:MAG: CBS domain-containing protein [Pyrobaculum sp.]|jgi:CBS domain-containing protein
MKIREFIKKPPISIEIDATIEDAARLMADNNIGAVAIVDKEKRPVGIITERDVVKAVAKRLPATSKATEAATVGDLLTAKLDDEVYEVLKKMRERRVRHLIVVDEGGKLAGVLSIRDFLEDQVLKNLGERVWWPKPED